jgi:hypothetical protein
MSVGIPNSEQMSTATRDIEGGEIGVAKGAVRRPIHGHWVRFKHAP